MSGDTHSSHCSLLIFMVSLSHSARGAAVIGQDRTVYSIKLIARDTVEEKVLALQRRKQMVIDATVRAGGRALQSMDWQDVKDLLDL